ncbi:MAG TPA: UvrD-helicase domain-containing protein, partial [Acidimicrobiales bacterium]|nr:UvrD-helicase domain-containing protein [Acidimicrobiales bacterium]
MTADRPAREAIATDLDATLFVEAGAGSGKTTQLVARLLGLLLSGRARIEEVAAITFTEAAAAELGDRLAGELEAAAAGAAGTTPEEQALAVTALGGLDGAAITTLHGFSRRVLAEHPFAAGLPPVFEVLDQVRAMVAFDERWDELVDGLLADPSTSQTVSWALACGIPLDALRTVARAFDDNWDRVPADPPPAPELPPVRPSVVLHPLRHALALAGACTDPEDRLLAHLADLTSAADRLQDAAGRGDLDALVVLATSMGQLAGGSRGRAGNWAGRKPEVLQLLATAQEARDETIAGAATAVLGRLVTVIGRQARRAADQRRREGRLAFHDLLVLARDLVRDDPVVREALHRQYRYLLVDEFQDTDPIQAELATRIAAGGPSGNGPWPTLRVPPGRLFFVGDPKQSIYRFRRADLGLFGQVRAELAGRVLELTTNFRSVPGIVDWVDGAFGQLFDGQLFDGGRSGPRALAARPVHADPGPPVRVLGLRVDPATTAEEARQREADDIAAAVLAVRDERWPVGDEGRPARLADVTVLVPTRRSVPALQEALDTAGVPHRLESSSLVYSAPEVQDLLAIVRAVDDPTDEPAVVAALRSPGFGCGDDDLVRFRMAGGHWDFRADPPSSVPGDDPVVAGLQALGELHAGRWWSEVSELVGRVVDDRRLLPLALDDPRWREAWRRLRFVVDQARQFTDAVPGDLRRFLAWVDLQQADDAKVTEVVLPESDVDAVRIMTVHAAKGLEFPVVVLAGTGTEPRRSTGSAVLFGPEGPELGIRVGLSTPGYPVLVEREARLDAEEQVRLLYVA